MLIACAKDVDVRSNTIGNLKQFGKLEGGKEFGIDSEAAIYVDQAESIRFDSNKVSGKGVVFSKAAKPAGQ